MFVLTVQKNSKGDFTYFYYEPRLNCACKYVFSNNVMQNGFGKMLIVACCAGPAVTFLSPLFNGSFLLTKGAFFPFSVILLCVVFFGLFLSSLDIRKVRIGINKTRGYLELPYEELESLYNEGKNRRIFNVLLILLLLFCSKFFLELAVMTYENMYLFIFYGLVFILTMVLSQFAPIQIIKFKLYLRRCKKECQKK